MTLWIRGPGVVIKKLRDPVYTSRTSPAFNQIFTRAESSSRMARCWRAWPLVYG